MQFLGPVDGKPIFHGRQRELDNLPLREQKVDVEDARPRQDTFSLDVQGFQMIAHRTAVNDFLDPFRWARHIATNYRS